MAGIPLKEAALIATLRMMMMMKKKITVRFNLCYNYSASMNSDRY